MIHDGNVLQFLTQWEKGGVGCAWGRLEQLTLLLLFSFFFFFFSKASSFLPVLGLRTQNTIKYNVSYKLSVTVTSL